MTPTGTTFTKETEGYTMSGFGKIRRMYEVMEINEKGLYSCKLIMDNTLPAINPDYRELFSEEQINKILEINKLENKNK